MIPCRRVTTQHDLELFEKSSAFNYIVSFILELNESVKGLELGLREPVAPVIPALDSILDKVNALIALHPSSESDSRFGKPEFKQFYDDVASHSREWVAELLAASEASPETSPQKESEHIDEIATYLQESWGSRSRIDYGSGHELNFLCFLLCLDKLHLIPKGQYANLVLDVFAHYLRVMQEVQKEYYLEPAGSHGMWGLDDYHFLPFLFGSGQLRTHQYLRPNSIHDDDLVDMFASKYFYFGLIKLVNSVKTASLRWHSPMLDDISSVKKWEKVNQGMIKMYKVEVLGKLPIVQHILFGDLIPAPQGVTAASDVEDEPRHVHCWADCCGIRVPSAVAVHASKLGSSTASTNIPILNENKGHLLPRSKALPID